MNEKPIGDLLDSLGVRCELDDEDLVSSAVVVLSVLVPGQAHPRLAIANSESLTWIEQAGLLRLAEAESSMPPSLTAEDDEP